MSTVTLRFERDELLYDIKNAAYDMAKSLPEESELRRVLTDIGEEGAVDRVTRIMNLEMARCRERLFSYTKEMTDENEEYNDVLTEEESYVIKLKVNNYSKTTAKLLTELIHNYIVYSVLSEWADIHNIEGDHRRREYISDKAGDMMKEINLTMSKTLKHLKLKQQPF